MRSSCILNRLRENITGHRCERETRGRLDYMSPERGKARTAPPECDIPNIEEGNEPHTIGQQSETNCLGHSASEGMDTLAKQHPTSNADSAQTLKLDTATEEILLIQMKKFKAGKMKLISPEESEKRLTRVVKQIKNEHCKL
jgi:hypothetical protein